MVNVVPYWSHSSMLFSCDPEAYPSTCWAWDKRNYSIVWPDGFQSFVLAELTYEISRQTICCVEESEGAQGTFVAEAAWSGVASSESGSWLLSGAHTYITWDQMPYCVCSTDTPNRNIHTPWVDWFKFHQCEGGGPGEDGCEPPLGCIPPSYEWIPESCECRVISATPILVGSHGHRLELTDAEHGVSFDINADGTAERVSWTSRYSDDAFLFLGRNDNGTIDDGSELFGAATPQPIVEEPNGFLALAAFDDNGDGKISAADVAFAGLGFWIDRNHNGSSE